MKGNISKEELEKLIEEASKEMKGRINNVEKSINHGAKLADKITEFKNLRDKINSMENKFLDKVFERRRNIVLGGTGLAMIGLIVGNAIYNSRKNNRVDE